MSTSMETLKEPRSTEQATAIAEHFANLDGQIAAIEADRKAGLADVNARADRAANELIARREVARGKLEAWWGKAGAKLTEGKRKSIELGGCVIGSRAGKATLSIAGDEKDIVERLRALRWAKPFLRVKTTLDRVALLKGVDGRHQAALAEIGIGKDDGGEIFVLERVQQGGTLGGN